MPVYQVCRWYDPYPRLAFALQLLKWAPAELRQTMILELADFIRAYLGSHSVVLNDSLSPVLLVSSNRAYDDSSPLMRQILETLKTGPEILKYLSADKLLYSLEGVAGSERSFTFR